MSVHPNTPQHLGACEYCGRSDDGAHDHATAIGTMTALDSVMGYGKDFSPMRLIVLLLRVCRQMGCQEIATAMGDSVSRAAVQQSLVTLARRLPNLSPVLLERADARNMRRRIKYTTKQSTHMEAERWVRKHTQATTSATNSGT